MGYPFFMYIFRKSVRTIQDLGAQTVGTVGSSPNNSAGHVLVNGSWTSPSSTTLHFWNLAADANDDVSHANPVNLTNNGTILFSATSVQGTSSAAATLNGTTQYFSSASSQLNTTANTAFSIGGWFRATDWTPSAANTMFQQGDDGAGDRVYKITLNTTGIITCEIGATSGSYDVTLSLPNPGFTDNTWHHFAWVYDRTNLVIKTYVDGEFRVSTTLSSLRAATTARLQIGAFSNSGSPSLYFAGAVQDCFLYQNTALNDDEIRRLYAVRYTHQMNTQSFSASLNVTSNSQVSPKNSGDHVVHQSTTELFAIHDTLSSTDSVRYFLMDLS